MIWPRRARRPERRRPLSEDRLAARALCSPRSSLRAEQDGRPRRILVRLIKRYPDAPEVPGALYCSLMQAEALGQPPPRADLPGRQAPRARERICGGRERPVSSRWKRPASACRADAESAHRSSRAATPCQRAGRGDGEASASSTKSRRARSLCVGFASSSRARAGSTARRGARTLGLMIDRSRPSAARRSSSSRRDSTCARLIGDDRAGRNEYIARASRPRRSRGNGQRKADRQRALF